MAAFLAGKLACEKNGRFVKAWLGKRSENLWQGRERKLSESVEIVESAKTFVLSFSKCKFPVTGRRVVEQVRWSFLLNEHGDLHFLLHKNIVHIILPNSRRKLKKKYRKGKKILPKACAKPLLRHANYHIVLYV